MALAIRMIKPIHEAWAVSKWILTHPSNQGRRLRQYRKALTFQIRGRLLRRPTIVTLGECSRIMAELHDHASALCAYANPPDYAAMRLWAEFLHPGDLFVDVGANSGTYSVWAAERGAKVIAIEPDEDARRRLRRNCHLNGYDVQIIPSAVADKLGELYFTRGRGSMNCLAVPEDANAYKVSVLTLDEIIGDRRVAGVKIDVEGAEHLALLGAQRALKERRIDLLQLEWNHASVQLLGEDRAPIQELLRSCGYRLFRPGDPSPELPMSGVDVFATPEDRANSDV